MTPPSQTFEDYLYLADQVARKLQARIRHVDIYDDVRSEARAEIWHRFNSYDPNHTKYPDVPLWGYLYKMAEYAAWSWVSKYVFVHPRKPIELDGWRGGKTNDGFDYNKILAEPIETPPEEIRITPVFGKRARVVSSEAISRLPLKEQWVIKKLHGDDPYELADVAREVGVSTIGELLDIEQSALELLRQDIGLKPRFTFAKTGSREEIPEDGPKKTCTKCGEEQVLEAFPRQMYARDGRATICKACARRSTNEHSFRKKAADLKWWQEQADKGIKACKMCRRERPFRDFVPDGRTKDGLSRHCVDCLENDAVAQTYSGVKRLEKVDEKTLAPRICSRGRLCLSHPLLGKPGRAVPGNQRALCAKCQDARHAERRAS